MVPVSLSKTSGLRLLSYCNPSCSGAIALRSLLPISSSASYHHSAAKGNGQPKTRTNPLSISIASLGGRKETLLATPRGRLFCTVSNVAADPSSPSTADTSGGDKAQDEGGVDTTKIKEIANTLDIRVGKILKAWRHEEADSLYVEEVDIGEPEPRTICSGLVKYVPLEHLQGKSVVVLANLKPRNMRGVKSSGMLMAASDSPHENVELLEPPEGSAPGERVWFGSDGEELPEAASPNQVAKKKIWEQVQPHLSTDDSCVAWLGGTHVMLTSVGPVVSKSLKKANIS